MLTQTIIFLFAESVSPISSKHSRSPSITREKSLWISNSARHRIGKHRNLSKDCEGPRDRVESLEVPLIRKIARSPEMIMWLSAIDVPHSAHLSRGMSSSAGTACTDAEEDAEDVENDVTGTSAQSSRYLPLSSSSSLSRIRHRRRASDHLEGLRLDGSSVVHRPPSSDDTSGSTVEDTRPSTPRARG